MNLDACRQKIAEQEPQMVADLLGSVGPDRDHLIDLLRDDPEIRDDILDDINLSHALLERERSHNITPHLYIYVGIRHFLRANNISSRNLADYLATTIVFFTYTAKWNSTSELLKPRSYINSLRFAINSELWEGHDESALSLHAHLGNYILFITGMLPNVVKQRMTQGDPNSQAYEQMGSYHYQMAANTEDKCSELLLELSEQFEPIREALNKLTESSFL